MTSASERLTGFAVEEVERRGIDGQLELLADSRATLGIDPGAEERRRLRAALRLILSLEHLGGDPRRVDAKEHVGVGAELLEDGDRDVDRGQPGRRSSASSKLSGLMPSTMSLAAVAGRRAGSSGSRYLAEEHVVAVNLRLDEVHRR